MSLSVYQLITYPLWKKLMQVTGLHYFECTHFNFFKLKYSWFPGGSEGKASAYNAGDPGSIPGSGRSSGEGNGNPLQYSCLENPMDGGAW